MKKEFYRRALPHFQQPGQAYFVTWSLKDAVPKKALKDYSEKLENYAYAIMPNHVHWVFGVFEKDENNDPVWLQDILHSVKRFSGNRINKLENRTGPFWQKESFDTTIRNEKHLYFAIKYTLLNPVSAGLVKDWKDWPGCWCSGNLIGDF